MCRKAALLATCVLFCADGVAVAQTAQNAPASSTTPSGAPTDQIQEIIVTAQKRSQSANDVGLTVNVVASDELALKQITRAADLTRAVPGLTVAENSDGTPIYTLRGVSFNSTDLGASPTVSVYVDEAPVPFSIMTEGALLDLERVEVLKGPQGTLFGQNSTAGAFNYIAAKPTKELAAGLSGTFSRFDTFQGEGYVSGPLTDTLGVRVSASGTTSGPYQISATRDEKLGRQDRAAGRVLLNWEPSDALRISLNLNGWIDRSENQAPQIVQVQLGNPANPGLPGLKTAPITTRNARDADWDPNRDWRRHNNFYQAVGRIDFDIAPNTTLTSLTDYTHVKIRSFADFDGTALTVETLLQTGYVEAFNQEFRLTGQTQNASIRYIIGANYQNDHALQNGAFDVSGQSNLHPLFGPFSVDTALTRALQHNRTEALFANADFDVTSNLTLSAGLRQTWVRHNNNGCTYDTSTDGALSTAIVSTLRSLAGLPPIVVPPGGCTTLTLGLVPVSPLSHFNERNLSWRGNINYKLSPETLLYGTLSRGFKAGNYPIVAAISESSLLPVVQEKLTSYEAGIKGQYFDRRVSINLAGYYYDYINKQLQVLIKDPFFGFFQAVRNVPKSNVYGFDADVTVIPATGLTLHSSVTYAKSSLGNAQGVDASNNPVNFKGNAFNLAPKWITVNDFEYKHALNENLNGLLGATLVYNSRTFADLAQSPSQVIRSFTTVDLRAGVVSGNGRWQATVFGRNVFNVYHWNYSFLGGDAFLRYASPPVTYGVTVSHKF